MASARSWSCRTWPHAVSGGLLVVNSIRAAALVAFVDDVEQDIGGIGSVGVELPRFRGHNESDAEGGGNDAEYTSTVRA